MFSYDRTEDRLTLRRPETRWLSNGFDGGFTTADAAHNLTVEEGFDRTDLATYASERLGSVPAGPTLLTGVAQSNARGARFGSIEAVVTAGVSNPAVLPMDPVTEHARGQRPRTPDAYRPGTVNLFVGSRAGLTDGGLAGVLATAIEAKTATLLEVAGCSGTTSDAVVVGCPVPSDGGGSAFAGSATEIGNATRVCVREAVVGALKARYGNGLDDLPEPDTAEYGAITTGSATIFDPY